MLCQSRGQVLADPLTHFFRATHDPVVLGLEVGDDPVQLQDTLLQNVVVALVQVGLSLVLGVKVGHMVPVLLQPGILFPLEILAFLDESLPLLLSHGERVKVVLSA